MQKTGGAMETVTTATVTGAIDTVETIATETGIAMETEIETAMGTGTATAAAGTVIVVTETEAGGTEMIGGVRGTGETGVTGETGETGAVGMGGTEMIALLSLNHQSVERAGGTTKKGTSVEYYVQPAAP